MSDRGAADNRAEAAATANWQPLSLERHGGLTWRRCPDLGFSAGLQQVALAATELQVAALALPLGFVETGAGWSVVALLGPEAGRNCYLRPSGRWRGRYLPAGLRAHPFSLDSDPDRTLLLDEASGLIDDRPGGLPLFNQQGRPSRRLEAIRAFLLQWQQGREQAAILATALVATGLLKPWPQPFAADLAIWQVDEAALEKLAGRSLLRLRRLGALPLIYAQLISKPNVLAWLTAAESRPEPAADVAALLEPDPGDLWLPDSESLPADTKERPPS